MNEISLFSIRQVLAVSMFLGLLSLIAIGQAISNDSNDVVDDVTTTTTTTTTSSSISTTNTPTSTSTTTTTSDSTTTIPTNTSTNTNSTNTTFQDTTTGTSAVSDVNNTPSMTETETEVVVSTATDTIQNTEAGDLNNVKDNIAVGDSDEGIFERAGFNDIAKIDENPVVSFILVSTQFIVMSSIFFLSISAIYTFGYNNPNLINYVEQSVKLAGMKAKINKFGKTVQLKYENQEFSLRLVGINTLKAIITLPQSSAVDPLEFGLRTNSNKVETSCNLELLPIKMQVVKLYFIEMNKFL